MTLTKAGLLVAQADAALIAGVSAALVGVLSGAVSYVFGRLTLRDQLANKLKELRVTAEQDREKAIREYSFQAMKSFRETVAGPKSQIIEAVQDQSSFMSTFLPYIYDGKWWERLSTEETYRRYVLWKLVRPYVWIEILDRSMLDLDRTLGDWVKDELRFVGYCRLVMRAATEKEIFADTDYDYPTWGHLWEGDLNELMEQLILTEGTSSRCISQAAFMKGRGDPHAKNMTEQFLRLVQDDDVLRDLRRARLVMIYSAANLFLEEFPLPYSRFEPWPSSVTYVDRLVSKEDLKESMRKAITTFLSQGKGLLKP